MNLNIRLLQDSDAAALAPLIAAYSQLLRRGAPRRPDQYYAEQLLQDDKAEVIGAFEGEVLKGFSIFFDLPEAISGRRVGHLDDLFVDHQYRGNGISTELVKRLSDIGKQRNWTYLHWLVSEKNEIAMKAYSSLAEPAAFQAFSIPINPPAELSA